MLNNLAYKYINNLLQYTIVHTNVPPMNGVLSINGAILDDTKLREVFKAQYQQLLNKLTIRTKRKIGFDLIAKIFKYDVVDGQKIIHLPRSVSEVLMDNGIVAEYINTIPDGRVVQFEFEGELFDNQTLIIDHLMNECFNNTRQEEGFATAVLNMAAGLGKTWMAAGLIAKVRRNTLFIVMRKKLQLQAAQDLQECFPKASIARPDGTANAEKYARSHDIVVMVIDSAMRLTDSFFGLFGFIIFDEIHMYASKRRAEIFWKSQVRCVLGMSATTNERIDKFDAVYYKHLGKPIHASQIPGYTVADAKFIGKVRVVKYFGEEQYTRKIINETTGYVNFDAMLNQFINDPVRNKVCVDEILRLYDDKTHQRYIFGFSDRREHLETIQNLLMVELAKRGGDEGQLFTPELVMMRGGSKDEELKRANSARIILTTYGYGGTGISIQHANSVVMMTPRKHGHKQFLPRAMRRGSDMAIVRIFVDIVDSRTTVKNQFYSRRMVYDFFEFDYSETVSVGDVKKKQGKNDDDNDSNDGDSDGGDSDNDAYDRTLTFVNQILDDDDD